MTDFLNNLWVAVSTPNDLAIKILCVLLIFIEIPLTLYLLTSIFNFKPTRKQKNYI